jgi:hypothetical protein
VFPKNKIIRALKKKCLEAGINVDDVFETWRSNNHINGKMKCSPNREKKDLELYND